MRRSIGLLAAAVVLSLGGSAKADIFFDFQNNLHFPRFCSLTS